MIVVDTQMLVYLTIPAPETRLAQHVARTDGQWQTSPLWRSEFRNVVAGLIRRGALDLPGALQAFAEAEEFIEGEVLPGTQAVLSLVTESRCSAYDLEFVAVAQALGVRLVTNDKQVLAAFPGVAVAPEAFVAG